MTKKLPLTIIIIFHEENEKLYQAITSAQIAEEILLISTNPKIYKKVNGIRPAVIIMTKFNMAMVRNKANRLARYKWVMHLDSDEVITSNSYEIIADLISKDQDYLYSIIRQDIFWGKRMQYGEARQRIIRLSKKDTLRFSRPVHEMANLTQPVKKTNILIEHYAHDSIASFLQKITKYSEIEALSRGNWNLIVLIQLLFYPLLKFKYNYLFKLGLLDGMEGLVYSLMMSLHSLFVRVKIYEKSHQAST